MGSINGQLIVSDTLSLKSTSSVLGEIKTKVLVIEPEAKFTGTCEMDNKQQQSTIEPKIETNK